jgi:hypothetical protein
LAPRLAGSFAGSLSNPSFEPRNQNTSPAGEFVTVSGPWRGRTQRGEDHWEFVLSITFLAFPVLSGRLADFPLAFVITFQPCSPKGIQWFEFKTHEVQKNVFTTDPMGDVCYECGTIAEGFPNDEKANLLASYKSNSNFRMLFEQCRSVLAGDLPRHWRRNVVKKNTEITQTSQVTLCCVEEAALIKYFKALPDSACELEKLKLSSWKLVPNPENELVNCQVFKTRDHLPRELPVFERVISSSSVVCMEDLYLDRDDCHEDQAAMSLKFLCQEDFSGRQVRLNDVAAMQSWESFSNLVEERQEALRLAEQERLRQLELADQGLATNTTAIITQSSSRFNRPTGSNMQRAGSVVDQLALKAETGQQQGRGGGGRAAGRGGGRSGRGGGRGAGRPDISVASAGPVANVSSVASSSSAIAVAPSAGSSVGAFTPRKATRSAASLAPESIVECAGQVSEFVEPYELYVVPPELAKLLVSSHGKAFPGLEDIMYNDLLPKRELSGVRCTAHTCNQRTLLVFIYIYVARWHASSQQHRPRSYTCVGQCVKYGW